MRVIIAAAGTGGHINPGIAIANKIKQEEPNSEIIFIGTGRKLEIDLVSRDGYELKAIEAYGFNKKINIENIKKNIKTIKGFWAAKKILKEFKPDVVIGMGGYICGAVISAAHSLKIPTILHESNAYPGLAVRMLVRKADTILVGLEEAKKYLTRAKNVVYTGTPTKLKPLNISKNQRLEIMYKAGFIHNMPLVLVFGGSQGAKAINDAMVKLISKQLNKNYQIIWGAGQDQYEDIKEALKLNGVDAERINNVKVLPYIYNMNEIMGIAALVVARSGAMTLTELSLMGKPAIFIPLPTSRANRQEENSRVFEKNGAARVILNNELNENNLNENINSILENSEKLNSMGEAAKKMAVYDVEERIWNEIKKLVNNKAIK